MGGEYVHWLGTDAKFSEGRRHYDPRARLERAMAIRTLAAQRMLEPRFQEVLRKASCARMARRMRACTSGVPQCHDPLG